MIHGPYATRRTMAQTLFLLAVLLAWLPASRVAQAAGEPTVTIMMSVTSLTAGTTADVTFAFSARPIGFDNGDIDLSDANGVLSVVAPTGDPRRYAATFTPNAGVYDEMNTIGVGVQWTDTLGVSPLSAATGPNFTVNTSAPSGAGQCPAPSVAIASPKAGDVLIAGGTTDVFWTANGCQATSIRLALSADGGATYATPVATSATPFSGYYRWTVPDLATTKARLQATLVGQGGVSLATGETAGDFTVQSRQTTASEPVPPSGTDAGATAAPPDAAGVPTGAETSSSAPAPQESPAADGGGSTAPPEATSSTVTPPTSEPSPPVTPASGRETQEHAPLTEPRLQPSAPQPMPETTENQALTIDAVQGAVETASLFAPSYLELGFSFVLGALAMLATMLGVRKLARERRAKRLNACAHCHGTGEEPAEEPKSTCGDCEGSGTAEEEEEQSMECAHCEGEGSDPCHECKGEGKDATGKECAACRGGGVTLDDPEDADSDEPADCEICGGEGEITATIKRKASCETCGGTGKF